MISPSVEDLSVSFAKASSLEAARAAIIDLVRAKRLGVATRTEEFRRALMDLAARARRGEGIASLQAAALLARVIASANLAEADAEEMRSWLRPEAAPPGAPAMNLPDKDDRIYLAQALGEMTGAWKLPYLAQALAEEASGADLARAELSQALVRDAGEASAAFDVVASALARLHFGTKDPATSRARRLSRVTTAMETALTRLRPPAGRSAGVSLARMAASFTQDRANAERSDEIECTRKLLRLLDTLVRSDISCTIEAGSYEIVEALRRKLHPRSWPSELSGDIDLLAQTATQALILLARQGVADDGLRRIIVLLVGDVRAGEMLSAQADAQRGISSNLRFWLQKGKAPPDTVRSSSLERSAVDSLERDLALLLRAAVDADLALQASQDRLTLAAAMAGDDAEASWRRVSSRFSAVVAQVQDAASHRAMRLRGAAGETAEFVASDHRFAAGGLRSRIVRLLNPVVERVLEGRAPETVLPADVDPL